MLVTGMESVNNGEEFQCVKIVKSAIQEIIQWKDIRYYKK